MDHRLEQRLRASAASFDRLAAGRERWKKHNYYYYRKISDYYRFYIPEGYRVLEVGSGDGDLLASLKPSRGLGVDASAEFVRLARERHPKLEFRQGFAEALEAGETFDYIVLSDLVGHLEDVQAAFERIRKACKPSTRIVISYYNYLWEPLLSLGSKLGLRMKQKAQNWLSLDDLENLLGISGFDVIKKSRKVIFPFNIPVLSELFNSVLSNLPFFRHLCLIGFIVARPEPHPDPAAAPPSASIVVACRNEKGNIEEIVRRMPSFPGPSEILFVDGRSTDGTCEEIDRVSKLYPEKNVRLFHQAVANGKGGAVRIGFENAKNDILIIHDADNTVAPEDAPKFYRLLAERRGEFINGTRMVYQMQKGAMRFLNILGNKFFSIAFTYLLEQTIKDTLCGTKALYRSDYLEIARNRAYFGEFDPFGDFDLLFGAARLNLKIVEVPVRYYERTYGTTKIRRFHDGWLLLGMCGIALKKLKFI